MQKTNLHFIIGIWRSGTTLMREVLGMNENLHVFPEHFLLLRLLESETDWTKLSKEKFYHKVLNDPDFYYFAKPDQGQLEKKLAEASSLENGMKACYEACLPEGQTATHFIDKNPIYSYYLPQLLENFPASKFIWMLREPKDNCISRAKHSIQSWKNYDYLAHWWNYTNHEIAKVAKQYPDRFHLLPYDEMVKNPEPFIKEVCDFIDLPFKADMLEFDKKKKERADAFIAAAKERDGEIDPNSEYAKRKIAMWENLQKPINTSKTRQWEKELSPSQIQLIDQRTKAYYEALKAGNYEMKIPSAGFYQLALKLSMAKLKWNILRS